MFTHGLARGGKPIPEYGVWNAMISRCTNPNNVAYANYGGRGITVCPQWRGSVVAFLNDVGRRPGPGYTLERIDNNRGYEPGNVRWATRAEQNRNTRANVMITIDGVTRCQNEWAAVAGIKVLKLRRRLLKGWSGARLLSPERTPIKLSDADAASIRELAAQGVPYREIAERFAVSRPTVSEIATGRKHRTARQMASRPKGPDNAK